MQLVACGIVRAGVDMKNSKEYAKKIQKLYRTLARMQNKVQKPDDEEVTNALVYAIISNVMTENAATAAVKRLSSHFVDWNDLRVAKTEEIVEVLEKDTQSTRNMASTLTAALNGIFNQYHTVNLEALKKAGKRPARQALEKIEGVGRFAVDYCMLTSLKGHAIPLTDRMLEYLRANDLVDQDADEQTVEGFLAKQIPAKNGYGFYVLLRHESEKSDPTKARRTRKKTKTSKEIKKKTTKKKTQQKKKK